MNEELIEEGIVLKTENGFAVIELSANDNCDECSAKIICKPRENSQRTLKVENPFGVEKGDKVIISIPGKTLLRAAFNLYFYPLVLLITGILLGLNIFTNFILTELYAFLFGCLFVSVYYLIIFKLSVKLNSRQPVINKIN